MYHDYTHPPLLETNRGRLGYREASITTNTAAMHSNIIGSQDVRILGA